MKMKIKRMKETDSWQHGDSHCCRLSRLVDKVNLEVMKLYIYIYIFLFLFLFLFPFSSFVVVLFIARRSLEYQTHPVLFPPPVRATVQCLRRSQM